MRQSNNDRLLIRHTIASGLAFLTCLGLIVAWAVIDPGVGETVENAITIPLALCALFSFFWLIVCFTVIEDRIE